MGGGIGELQPGTQGAIRPVVLVVEDEVLVRMVIADKLREAGYVVIEVADAQQALDALAHCFDVRVIVSDIQMPGSLDGRGLAHAVRSAYPAIKIVLTSGHFAQVDSAAHDGFFPKPYDAAQIIRHIGTLID
jgi:two-component system, response regulator PdtaR